jgi:hypothetical protein
VSTIPSLHERSYRALVRLYPRGFRREYGDDIVQLFRDDLHERGALRGWGRALSDLILSVPIQHVEATVAQPSTSRAAQVGLAAAGLAVLAVFAVGRYVVVAVPLTAAIAAAALLYWRSRLPYREAVTDASSWWWRVVVAGAALLAGIGLAANYGPDFDWFPWHLAAFLFVTAWALMITGVVLGLVRLTRHLRRQPASSF